MIPSAYKNFVEQAIFQTETGNLKWQKVFNDSFYFENEDSKVEIGHYIDDNAELGFYYLDFVNYDTKNKSGFRINSYDDDYSKMEHLYTVAGASANNIESELDNFLKKAITHYTLPNLNPKQ